MVRIWQKCQILDFWSRNLQHGCVGWAVRKVSPLRGHTQQTVTFQTNQESIEDATAPVRGKEQYVKSVALTTMPFLVVRGDI